MRMPSAGQMKSLERAASRYSQSILAASGFLAGHGVLDLDTVERWRIGVVESPEPGHEQYVGRLCIPYMNLVGVIGLKFRCLQDHVCKEHGHEKYLALPGQPVYLYNVAACDSPRGVVHVSEGETDCWALSTIFPDDPVVGCPGAGQWQPHWPAHFDNFDRVLVWPDGDKAGQDMGSRWRKAIQAVEVVRMPWGMDVCELLAAEDVDVFRRLIGDEDD